MATPKHDPAKELAWLKQVDEQIETAKSLDRSAMMLSQHYHKWGDKILTDLNEKAGVNGMPSLDELTLAAKTLHAAGDALNPIASVSWKQEEVVAAAERLRAFVTLGFLDGTEETTRLIDTYTSTRRAPGVTKVYDDRPARVRVVASDGSTITEQVGNTENAPGNIKSRIMDWLKKNEVVVTEDQEKGIREAIRQACVDKVAVVPVLDFASIVHVAAQ